ncbi:MAG: hypothetical protein QG628_723 [Patescibacteria group bacterium]|jgi:hypothetical protein|nr:hypothetical protein [Patescibacteria group bacterium]
MSINICEFKDLHPEMQSSIAEQVSDYTSGLLGETPQMLPISANAVMQKQLGIVALCEESFAGYVGATNLILHNSTPMLEVGSLWVPGKYRHKGIAHELVGAITSNLVDRQYLPYAFCNELSLPIFKSAGYLETCSGSVPSCALDACSACPMKPKTDCCDTIVVLGGGIQ